MKITSIKCPRLNFRLNDEILGSFVIAITGPVKDMWALSIAKEVVLRYKQFMKLESVVSFVESGERMPRHEALFKI
jgi:hypothetical protein